MSAKTKPIVWAALTDAGLIRIWTAHQDQIARLSEQVGAPLQPLYDQAALDAAVAAERERCHTHAARALDSATEGEWADAAMSLLAISKGGAA